MPEQESNVHIVPDEDWVNETNVGENRIFIILPKMLPDATRGKIENITQGIVIEGTSDHCTSVSNFLCGCYPTSKSVKTDFEGKAIVKKEQAHLIFTVVLV